MAETQLDLNQWLKRVRLMKTRREIFQLLDEFRVLGWTNEERARMSREYIRVLEGLKPETAPDTTSQSGAEGNDGPVWYEKM